MLRGMDDGRVLWLVGQDRLEAGSISGRRVRVVGFPSRGRAGGM